MVTGLDRDSLELILSSLAEAAKERLTDKVLLELDEKDEFPEAIVRDMFGRELGVQLLFVPEAHGGMGGSAFDIYRISELMAKIDLGIATGVLATFLGSEPISVGGTPEQKERWIGRIAQEGVLFAYGATEPGAGSDLAALKTTAVRVEQGGKLTGYRLNGSKQWISNGGVADVYTILANAPGGPSWFVLDRGTPGFAPGKAENKHGIRASNTAPLSLDEVQVPPESLVGLVEGQGLHQAQAVFGYTRLMVAAFGLGAGWAALERAIPYSAKRIQAGAPLSEKQGYTHKLIVPHAVALEAARAYIEETADRLDRSEEGTSLNTEGAVAKYAATEAGLAAAEAAIQALGGYGYTKEYMVEKIRRDVRITTIYEGTSEIMEMTIARDRWQLHLKTRGGHYASEGQKLAGLPEASGARTAALALTALGELLERARLLRLTRHQHVLFRLGALVALGETAAAFARRSARALVGELHPKAVTRLPPPALAAMSRVFAREAARRISDEGRALLVGGGASDADALGAALQLPAITRAQAGSLTDMDEIARALYAALA